MAAALEDPRGPPAALEASQRVAVVATEADQRLILEILAGENSDATPTSLSELAHGIGVDGFGAAIVTEEALQDAGRERLHEAVERQPPWSDFPFILVADRAALEQLAPSLASMGKVSIVERPIHPLVLRNAARAALRARARQRESVSFLVQRQDAEEHLRQLTTSLEKRVRERMRDLRAANQRLVEEVRERLAAEERLRESEELYRYTVELSQQMVWTATREGEMVTVNQRFYDVTGASLELRPNDAWIEQVHPADLTQLSGQWAKALASGHPYMAQFRMRVADGSYRSFAARAAPRRDGEGRIVRWYGFTEDITEQKRADAARREAEERYRLAARATNDAIWDLDLDDRSIQWTASETAFFGYQDTEVTSLGWWEDRVHPQDRKRVSRSLDKAIGGRDTHWSSAYRFLKADGDYADVYDQCFLIRDESGRAVRAVGALSDVTVHSRAQAEIRRIQAELIHVSRLSAMGTMASTLAHELNQPLTAVSSYIRGSRRLIEYAEGPTMGEVRGALEAAEGAALRAGHIVKRLRELVARGNVSTRAANLPKLIEDASLIAFIDAHLLGVTYRSDLDPEADWVEADPVQVQQVVINLVRNALQALESQPRREVVIRTAALSKDMAEVSIADTGTGIAVGVREALFSPFQSTKAEGMGIGLSISRTIVEAHGGKIWAEDGPEGGTIFRFTLPRADPPKEAPE